MRENYNLQKNENSKKENRKSGLSVFNRILALVLSLVLALGCVSLFAFADDASEQTRIDEPTVETEDTSDPASSNEPAAEDSVSFAVVGGIHFVGKSHRGDVDSSFTLESKIAGVQVGQIDGLVNSGLDAVESLKKDGVKYLFVTGGLTYNGFSLDHYELSEILKEFELESGIQVIAVPGVGDFYNNRASFYSGSEKMIGTSCSPTEFDGYFKTLGRDKSTLYDKDRYTRRVDGRVGSNSYSFLVPDTNFRFIVIDAANYDNTSSFENGGRNVVGKIDDNLMDWIVEKTEEAVAQGQTVIGVCGWDIKKSGAIGNSNVLENCDDVAYKLADAGMHYILTGGSGNNDISSTVNINGETIYDIQTSYLTSFPNTIRQCTFSKDGLSTKLVDVDCVTQVISNLDENGDFVAYKRPFRETNSLKIQYENYDLAKYALNFVEDFIYNGLIPGVKKYGTIEDYLKNYYNIDIKEEINTYLGGGITLFGFLTFFDGDNVMNLLSNSVFPQLFGKKVEGSSQKDGIFVEDPVKLREIFYNGFKTVTSAIVSQVPCDYYIDTYSFGNYKGGGTLNDLLLSLIIQSKMGNEDIGENKFLLDVRSNLENGKLVPFLAEVLSDGIVKQIFIDGFLDNIEVDLEQLIFLDKENDSFGSYINTAVKWYLKLHNNSATYKGLLESLLKDGMFKDYGRSIDSAIEKYISDYFKGDRALSVGQQLGTVYDYYTADKDPSAKSDYDCTVKYPGKVDPPEELVAEMSPSIITQSYNYDPSSSITISWYTSVAAVNTDIELYSKNSGFTGKNNIGVDGVFFETASEEKTREYAKIDFGFAGVGQTTENVIRHTVYLYDLKPSTTYYARVGDEELGRWSKTIKLKTAPESGKFSFVQITDTSGILQSHFEMDRNLANCIASVAPDSSFTLHSGNFVSNGNDYKQWQSMTKSMENLLGNYVTVPVKGVSEYRTTAISDNFTQFDFMDDKGKERGYYSFDISDAHITVIDSTNLRVIGGLSDTETKWIKNDIKNSDKKWNIVAVHNSVYTNGYSTQSNRYANFFKNLNTTLSGLRVDLVLSGDSDVYYRTDSVRDNSVDQVPEVSFSYGGRTYRTLVKPKGVVYSSIGASGKNGYAKHETYDTSKFFPFTGKSRDDSLPMFSKITVDGDNLVLETYTLDGNTVRLIDSLMIRKSGKEFCMGDVDGDGEITAKDARLALRISAQLEGTAFTKNIADVDGSGQVTAQDARTILRVSAQLESFEPIFNGDTIVY